MPARKSRATPAAARRAAAAPVPAPPSLQPPVIVIPGIEGTDLDDFYAIPREALWSAVFHKDYERLSMHPDDTRYEAIEPARVREQFLMDVAYKDLILALRHDLTAKRDEPTPVFGFPYDWRQDCRATADALGAFIEEVLARTALLRHYRPEPPARVDLVGHSMGGLIVADYLRRHGRAGRVRRVVTLASPLEGAVAALERLSTGMGNFSAKPPRDREREAARTMAAVYQLVPTYAGAVAAAPGLAADLFDAAAWQPSIVETLAEFIRLTGAETSAEALLARFLASAQALRRRARALDLSAVLPEGRAGWLAVVGTNAPTEVAVRIERDAGGPVFAFQPARNEWPRGVDTGDGTVPFLGACPRFLERERLVCVTPQDFSFWELGDQAVASLAGFHAMIPRVNLVQRLAIKFLRPEFGGRVWARRAPGVDHTEWPAWLPEKRD